MQTLTTAYLSKGVYPILLLTSLFNKMLVAHPYNYDVCIKEKVHTCMYGEGWSLDKTYMCKIRF